MRKSNLTIKVDKEIIKKFKQRAKEEKRSCGEIIRQIIIEYLEKRGINGEN